MSKMSKKNEQTKEVMNKKTNRIKCTAAEVGRNAYYQMPKFLFEEEFKCLSSDAIVLYCLIKDRHELSIKNGWVDDVGDVFTIFSRLDMQNALNKSEKTIAKAVKNLKDYDLIEEKRKGLGKPNLIYLLTIKTSNNYGSRDAKDKDEDKKAKNKGTGETESFEECSGENFAKDSSTYATANPTATEQENLRSQNRKYYGSRTVKSAIPSYNNKTDNNQTEFNKSLLLQTPLLLHNDNDIEKFKAQGITDDLIDYAKELAYEKNAPKWAYVRKILLDCLEKGIYNRWQKEEYERQRQQQRQQPQNQDPFLQGVIDSYGQLYNPSA